MHQAHPVGTPAHEEVRRYGPFPDSGLLVELHGAKNQSLPPIRVVEERMGLPERHFAPRSQTIPGPYSDTTFVGYTLSL